MATATISQIQITTVAAPGDLIEIETVAGASRSITKQNYIGINITGTGTLALGGFTLTLTGNATISGSHVGNVNGNISGGGTIALGGFTLTVAANSTINGSFVGSVAGAINGNITGGGTIALGGFTLTVSANATISGSHVGNISGGGTIATGGFTLTVAAASTISGSFVGSVAGAINGNITGGGTIALGGFTLTVSANATVSGSHVGNVAGNISGGGTIATGGFTLTLPASGTAALLGAANVFTVLQTIAPTATNANGQIINMPSGVGSFYASEIQYNGTAYYRMAARASVSAVVMAAVDLGNGSGGPSFAIGNNSNATAPAPGVLQLTAKNGTLYYLWVDTLAKLRISATSPAANDTIGTVVGTQT